MQLSRHWQLLLFLLVPLVYLAIFNYYPMFGVLIAFKDYKPTLGIFNSTFVGFKHFVKFFESSYFEIVTLNTLRISIYSLIVGYPLPIIFALLLNVVRHQKVKRIIQTITYIPHFISVVVIVGLVYTMLNPVIGLYGSLYRLFDLGIYPPDILGQSKSFIHIYVWSGIWQELGFSSIIYIAALSGVDPGLHEAAVIDGANLLQRIRHIDFPSILPTASIILILSFGGLMSVGFEKVYLMQNPLNLKASEVINTYIYKVGLTSGGMNYSFASAVGLFNSVINCALLVLANYGSRKMSDEGTSFW